MPTPRHAARTLAVVGLVACACGGSDPVISSVSLAPATIAAGGVVTVTVVGDGLDLEAATAAASAGLSAGRTSGLRAAHGDAMGQHLHAYLDTTDVNPLAMQTRTTFPITIPAGTAAGAHTIIVRLHDAEHAIIQPEVKASAALTVTSTRSGP
jgi:hypothetical protein